MTKREPIPSIEAFNIEYATEFINEHFVNIYTEEHQNSAQILSLKLYRPYEQKEGEYPDEASDEYEIVIKYSIPLGIVRAGSEWSMTITLDEDKFEDGLNGDMISKKHAISSVFSNIHGARSEEEPDHEPIINRTKDEAILEAISWIFELGNSSIYKPKDELYQEYSKARKKDTSMIKDYDTNITPENWSDSDLNQEEHCSRCDMTPCHCSGDE